MKTRIAISVAGLAFGVALASAPAFAQVGHVGKSLDDGGLVDVPPAPATKQLYNAVPPAPTHYGKALNDGGIVDNPSPAQMSAQGNVTSIQNPPHVGRALNDGGF
jgi:hypothetical protein